ncbi:MAG: hypothetical protein RL748_3972 [Pseudomonadota bacterium]|jgi:hypothetical protein
MAVSYSSPPSRWRSGTGLLVIAALHLALLYLWTGRTRHQDAAAAPPMLMWLLPSAPITPAPAPKIPTPATSVATPAAALATASRAKTRLPRALPDPVAVLVTPVPLVSGAPATEAVAIPEKAVAPAKPPVDPITGAGLPGLSAVELARAAEEIRKQAPLNSQVQKYERKESKLALGIAGAYRGDNGSETTEQIDLGDGRFMTKVRGPLGTYCVYKETMAVSGGRDQSQSGVRTKVTTCPR